MRPKTNRTKGTALLKAIERPKAQLTRLKDINWNQVYTFYEVARKQSMRAAADLLGISVPTVSEQINKLEKLLGISLFLREGRSLRLTGEGESLFQTAGEMFATGARFLDAVSHQAIGGYTVNVGIQESSGESVEVDFVSKYWDFFSPFGTVNTIRETTHEKLIDRILRGELDWGIVSQPPKVMRLNFRSLGKKDLVFCCSPQIYRRFKNKEDILRVLPLARSSWDHHLNKMIDDHLAERDIFPEEFLESDHRDLCINLSRRGRAVMIFPKDALRDAPWKGAVKSFVLGRPITLNFYAVWKRSSEKMVSIKKLIQLFAVSGYPESYEDPEHQIKVLQINGKPIESVLPRRNRSAKRRK